MICCERDFGHAEDGRLQFGQSGHWALPVAGTAVVWSAVADSVGLVNCRFQRHRTDAFDRVQTSGLGLRTGHTKHRYSSSQSRQRSIKRLYNLQGIVRAPVTLQSNERWIGSAPLS